MRRYRATFAPPPTYIPPIPESNQDRVHQPIALPQNEPQQQRPLAAPQPLKPLPPRVVVVSDFELRGEPDIRRITAASIVKSSDQNGLNSMDSVYPYYKQHLFS